MNEENKIYGSSKVDSDELYHIAFRNETLCNKEIVARVRGITEATCPECIDKYKMIKGNE